VHFEVVPGIPAGLGAASYAGVPLTYPGGGDTLTFVRGHEDEGKRRAAVDWTSLSRLDGTIVCYAGSDQLAEMLSALLAHGRPKDDSAALIYNGTLPTQETTVGTIEDIERMVKQSNDRRAAIMVVGRVAALREHLRWFDCVPCSAKRILVTSTQSGGGARGAARGSGAEAISAAHPHHAAGGLRTARRRVREPRPVRLSFLSANAVQAFIAPAGPPLDLRSLGRVKLCAVGSATSNRAARHGLKVDPCPANSCGSGGPGALLPSDLRASCLPAARDIGRGRHRPPGKQGVVTETSPPNGRGQSRT
jgi:uroporphyrinogen III methyltransferase/synthase